MQICGNIIDLARVRAGEPDPAFRPVALIGDELELVDGGRGRVAAQHQQARFTVVVAGIYRIVTRAQIARNASR